MAEKFNWYAPSSELLKCPVPGCNHMGNIITKIHCRLEHGMTRDEVGIRYGMPKRVLTYSENQIKARDAKWVRNIS